MIHKQNEAEEAEEIKSKPLETIDDFIRELEFRPPCILHHLDSENKPCEGKTCKLQKCAGVFSRFGGLRKAYLKSKI